MFSVLSISVGKINLKIQLAVQIPLKHAINHCPETFSVFSKRVTTVLLKGSRTCSHEIFDIIDDIDIVYE